MPPSSRAAKASSTSTARRSSTLSPTTGAQLRADSVTGTPEAYTVFNDQYQLGPTPERDLAFTHAYERRLAHVDSTNGVIGGVMVEDSDETVWPAEWDYLLVVDATILGMQLMKDDGWRDCMAQRDECCTGCGTTAPAAARPSQSSGAAADGGPRPARFPRRAEPA